MISHNNYGFSQVNGEVLLSEEILLSVIKLATKEINGVSTLYKKTHFNTLFKKYANSYYRGVKVHKTKNGLVIDVYVNILYGSSVPEIAQKVQENIKNGIASMMDMPIGTVNVNVMGVKFPKEESVSAV